MLGRGAGAARNSSLREFESLLLYSNLTKLNVLPASSPTMSNIGWVRNRLI